MSIKITYSTQFRVPISVFSRMAPAPIVKPTPKYTKLFINNEWVDAVSGKTFATYDPTDGKEICQIAEADKEDVDKVNKDPSLLVLYNLCNYLLSIKK